MYLCIKKKVRGGLANYSILESRQTFVCICHESRQLPDYWSIPTVQTVYGSRKTILNFVSSYTLNHPLPALRPSRRVTNHSCTKCRQPRPPASAPRSPWGISSNTWSTVPRGRRSSLASRREIYRRFSACCTRSGLDRQGRKGVARRRQAIAGAMERATRADGMLLDLEPMAWGATESCSRRVAIGPRMRDPLAAAMRGVAIAIVCTAEFVFGHVWTWVQLWCFTNRLMSNHQLTTH